MFSPKFLCSRVDKPLVFYCPTDVFYLPDCHPLRSWLPLLLFLSNLCLILVSLFHCLILVSLFHYMARVKIPAIRDPPPLSNVPSTSVVRDLPPPSNVSSTQQFNLTSTTPVTVETQSISRLESEVFLPHFLDLINTCNCNFFMKRNKLK